MKKINFNSFSLGRCGGTRFIFELSNGLVDRGFDVSITHAGLPSYHEWFTPIKSRLIECNISVASRFLNKYGIHRIDVHKAQEKNMIKAIPECDFNVATYYNTAVPTVKSGKGKGLYLVQHYEPVFFPEKSVDSRDAKASYDLPLTKLCVSKWLTRKVNGVFIGNGLNLNRFKRYPVQKKFDVIILQNLRLDYKGNYNSSIERLRKDGFKVLVVDDFSETELVKAYNLSKVLLCLSEKEGFGYLPLEAMACGTAVVSTNCTEYLVDKKNCLLLPDKCSLDDVSSKIKWLIDNPKQSQYLVEGGFETAKEYNFDFVVDRFMEVTN